jgi:hypothetical protein
MPASKKGPTTTTPTFFPRICDIEDGGPSDGDVTSAGNPKRERLTVGLAGREVGGGDTGEERRERERGTGDVKRAMGVGVVGVTGSGTVCGEGDLGWVVHSIRQ